MCRRVVPSEPKVEIAGKRLRGAAVAAVANEYGVSKGSVSRWAANYRSGGRTGVVRGGKSAPSSYNRSHRQ
ncbi:transposase-like protein [Saccharopolyspora phatthalungensis]|uniref:Transposase-like protein n=1 Tax=Saccharopolyspora phatthalungensis TaxID=664693 RepID=A0A840Q4W5_9PSEU|nr:helix-turn-helix domain-containing protein [Saccharopolyspora phatthalungensis]MBB5153729.1 transposase-like protein [Saccharopolyspora phatthalungensis]